MELSLRKCVHYIARYWWMLVCVVVFGGLVGFVVSTFDSGIYQASGAIKIEYSEKVDQSLEGYATVRSTYIANTIATIEDRDFLIAQFEKAGAQELFTVKNSSSTRDVLQYVTVEQNGVSDYITITCRTEHQEWSVGIVAGILEDIPGRIKDEYISCTVTSQAKLSDQITPPWITYTLLGLAIGLVAGIVALVIARAFDTRILEERDVTENFELELLGNLSEVKK